MSLDYDDADLAAIYDEDNPDGPDHDFYRCLATERGARRIVDLGCGTGLLTVTLAVPGRRVTGVDPAEAMLAVARSRAGGGDVEWVHGTAESLAPRSADLVVMSGNVAMHLIGDEWPGTLARVRSALRPGGLLTFDTRNPEARAWEGWSQALGTRETGAGLLSESTTVEAPGASGVVVLRCHNEFLRSGRIVDVEQRLQFRGRNEVLADLRDAGFAVVECYRNWSRDAFTGGPDQPMMIFVAG